MCSISDTRSRLHAPNVPIQLAPVTSANTSAWDQDMHISPMSSSRAETASLWLSDPSQHTPGPSSKGHREGGLPPHSEGEEVGMSRLRLSPQIF